MYLRLTALSLATVGCGQPSSNQVDEAGQSADAVAVGQLLREGKPEACAHAAVQAALMDGIRVTPDRSSTLGDDEWEEILKGAMDPEFSEYQASDANPAVGEVTCEVNVTISDMRIPTQYILRPSLENKEDFVIIGEFGRALSAYQAQIFWPANRLAGPREAAARKSDEEKKLAAEYAVATAERRACFDAAKSLMDREYCLRAVKLPEVTIPPAEQDKVEP